METVLKLVAKIQRCMTFDSISTETGSIVSTLRTYCLSDDEVITRLLEIRAKLIQVWHDKRPMEFAVNKIDQLLETCFNVSPPPKMVLIRKNPTR